jgi:hypothetical protein
LSSPGISRLSVARMKSANTFNRKPPRAASASSMLLIKELYSRDLPDMGGLIWIESGFTFDTKAGTGRGIVRLANVGSLQSVESLDCSYDLG